MLVLGHVDVIGLDVLVHVADDELGQGLQREGGQLLEALEEQRGDGLVVGDDLLAALDAAAETAVVFQHEGDALGQALDDGVHVGVGDHQLLAAIALEQAVDEHEGAQEGAHPAVLPEALHHRDGGRAHHQRHGHQVLHPGGIVHHRVLHAAPLAPFGHAGLVIVAAAQAADAVLGLPFGVKALQRLVDGSDEFVDHAHVTCLPECS